MVGCGLLGAPLAHALHSLGFSVVTLDRESVVAPPTDPLDQRCTALSTSSVATLSQWRLWELVEPIATAIDSVHVSHKGYFGATRLRASEHGVAHLGYVVENRHFQQRLQQALKFTSVQQFAPVTVTNVQSDSATAIVRFKTAGGALTTVQAKLIIAVDGVSSTVREAMGINATHVDYDQAALLTTVQLEKPHQHTAFERFTSAGPLAMLPSQNQTASVVCCVEPATAAHLKTLGIDEIMQYVQQLFGSRLGRFTAMGNPTFIPLVRIEATRQIDQRLVLLGNAARLLHPVAGQGYNLSLRDAAKLVSVMDKHDAGKASTLEEFVVARESDQQRVVQLTDTLARVFRGTFTPVGHLRALALLGLDTISPIRSRFADQAMGFRG